MLKKLAPLFVVIGASLWGVDGILLRPALYSLPVPLVVFVESALIAVILSLVLFKYIPEMKLLHAADWRAYAGVALFGGVIGTMAITRALFYVNFVNLSIVILIQKLQPVFAIALAAVFLKERPQKQFYFWAVLAIVGAYFMTFGLQSPNWDTGDKTAAAALFALLACLGFASSTVFSKRALKNASFQLGTLLRFLLTAALMLPIAFFTGDIFLISTITAKQFFIFLLIAFTTGGLGIFLYYYGLKQISASVSTICELAFPLTAVVLEYLYRDSILSPFQWVGAAVLFGSIFMVSRFQTQEKENSQPVLEKTS